MEFNTITLGKKIEAQTKLAQFSFPEVGDPNDQMTHWTDDNEHGYAAIFHQLLLEDDPDVTSYLENPDDAETGRRLAAKIKSKVLEHSH